MVKKNYFLFVCLFISILLIALAVFSLNFHKYYNQNIFSISGEAISKDSINKENINIIPQKVNEGRNIYLITNAEHLDSNRNFISNIYEQVKSLDNIWSETISSNEYVRVTFETNLTRNNDITIFPRIVSGNPTIEVYEKDKTTKIAEFTNINSNEYNKVLLTNLQGSQDTFDLKITGGSLEFDYIVDPLPNITFDPSTPGNASTVSSPNQTIVANISESTGSDTSSWIDFNRGLLGYWAMDYYNSTGIYDNSSWNNFGTFQQGLGTGNIATGIRGQALTFDGINDYLDAGNGASLNNLGEVTMAIWGKTNDGQPGGAPISKKSTESSTDGFEFEWYVNSNNIQVYWGDGAANNGGVISYTFNYETWYSIIVTIKSGNASLYVNGVYVDSVTGSTTIANTNTPLKIGNDGDDRAFNGLLDEVMIFNRSLSQTEIKALYDSKSNKFNASLTNFPSGVKQNYTVYAIDTAGNASNSGWRYFIVDSTPPKYTQVSTNNTAAGVSTNFSINVTDNIALQPNGMYIFSTNNTGVWVNNSGVNFTAISQWANVTKILNSTVGTRVGYRWYFNDSAGNTNSTSIYVLITTDTTSPYFTTIPTNASLFYANQSLLVTFVATDAAGFGYYRINDTRFLINQTGFLSNASPMAVGNYEINVTINDTSNNINWTRYKVQINKSTYYSCEVYFNATTPQTYPNNFIVYTNCSSAYSLYRNGTAINNNSVQNNGAGYFNYTVQRTDTANYTNTVDTAFFTVNKDSTNKCQVFFNETSPLNFPKTFRAWANCTTAFVLARNGTTIVNNSEQSLAVGAYNFSMSRNDTQNYTYIYNQSQFIINSVLDTTPPTITFEPPTPSNTSSTTNPVTIVANISDNSNTSSWIDFDRSLMLWLSFNGNSLDNSSYNWSTTNGGATFGAGKFGQAATGFTSTNHIDVNSSLDYASTNMTISFWMYVINGATPNRQNPIDKAYGGDGTITLEPEGYMTLYYGSSGGNANPYYWDSSPSYTNGTWEHWVIVRDRSGRTTQWYKNGVGDSPESYSPTYDPIHSTNALQIGYGYAGSLNGYMDEVLIFNRTLSSTEVKALYDSQNNKFNTSSMTLTNGQHNYTVYATDEAGNQNNSGWRNFILTGAALNCGDALNSAGTIYTLTSNVSAAGTCFTVTANNVTLDCQNNWITYSTGGTASTYGIVTNQFNTTIKNCNIIDGNWTSSENSRYGVFLASSSNGNLTNNTIITNSSHAIYVTTSSNNTLTNNLGTTNSWYGIYLFSSSNNTLTNNRITSNTSVAIYLSSSSNNNLTNNTGTSSGSGNGIYLTSATNNTLTNNTGKSNGGDGIALIYSLNNNLISNNATTNGAGFGISIILSSNNNLISNNATSTGVGYGIELDASFNNSLIRNTAVSNAGAAIRVEDFSSNNTLIDNNATSNTDGGIFLTSASNNNLTNNIGTSINQSGIYLTFSSSNNTLMNNTGTSNKIYGIILDTTSNNNTLISNRGISNLSHGIYIESSSNNTLTNNNGTSNSSYGIYLNGASNNILTSNNGTSYGGGYGISLNLADNNTLTRNTGISNSSIAIYIGSSLNNTLTGNNGTSYAGMGIYLAFADNNILRDNTFASNLSSGIGMESSSNNNLTNNNGTSNSNVGIYLHDSLNNLFINNTATSNTWVALYIWSSSNNTFISQTARTLGTTGTRYAVYFDDTSYNTIFRDCLNISGATKDVYYTINTGSVNNTFINCSYDTSKELVQGAGNQLIRKWYYRAYVNDTSGLPIQGANITAYNTTNSLQLTDSTNSSGLIQRGEVTEYVNTAGTRSYYNNYTINATKSGYSTVTHIFNFTIIMNKMDDFFTLDNGSCVYTGGNWIINCSSYCNITVNVNVGGNNISIIGIGTFVTSANISNYGNLHIQGTDATHICRVRCINGGCFKN